VVLIEDEPQIRRLLRTVLRTASNCSKRKPDRKASLKWARDVPTW
jgi:hypothetical protein